MPGKWTTLEIVIVGGGVAGVELAAELREATHSGIDTLIPPEQVRISVIEASDRLVPGLPERLSRAVRRELEKLDVNVLLDSRVTRVNRNSIILDDDRAVRAHLKIWAAGISAPDALSTLGQFEHDRIGRIKVGNTLQAVGYDNIFVLATAPVVPGPAKTRRFPHAPRPPYSRLLLWQNRSGAVLPVSRCWNSNTGTEVLLYQSPTSLRSAR